MLRRVFGLPEDSAGPAHLEPRVTRLLALVRDLIGQMPHVEAARKGYSFLSPTGIVVADLRPRKSGCGPKRARRWRKPPDSPPGTGRAPKALMVVPPSAGMRRMAMTPATSASRWCSRSSGGRIPSLDHLLVVALPRCCRLTRVSEQRSGTAGAAAVGGGYMRPTQLHRCQRSATSFSASVRRPSVVSGLRSP